MTNPADSNPDEDQRLLDYLRPLCDVMLELVDGAQELGGEHGLPAADSMAVAEIAEEPKYINEHWTGPVRGAHTTAGIVRFAAGDHVRSFARLFLDQPVPVFSHLVLARASLDACGNAYWLSDTKAGVEGRIQRYQVHRMLNAKELKKSPLTAPKAKGKEALDLVVNGANLLGWGATKGNPRVGITEEVAPKKLMRAVLNDDRTFGEDQLGNSELLWWYLSGATHSAMWALMQSVDATSGDTDATGEPLAAIFTNGESVVTMGLTVARAYEATIVEHAALFGWGSNRWTAARIRLNELRKQAVQAASQRE